MPGQRGAEPGSIPATQRRKKSLHFADAIYFSEYDGLKSGKKVKSARSKNKHFSLYKGCFVAQR